MGHFNFFWRTLRPILRKFSYASVMVSLVLTSGFFITPIFAQAAVPTFSNVMASNIIGTGAQITWTTSEPAKFPWVVYRTTTGSELQTNASCSNDITLLFVNHCVNLTGLSPSTLYHYSVKSSDSTGLQGISGDFTFTSAAASGNNQPPVPAAPTGPSTGATGVAYNYSATLFPDPDGQQVKAVFDWGDGTSFGFSSFITPVSGGSSSPSVSHSWAAAGTYGVRARAIDSSGAESGWTATYNVTISGGSGSSDTTPPSIPPAPTLGNITSSQIVLTWPASTDNVGVTGYKVYRYVGGSVSGTPVIFNVPTLNLTETGLSSSTSYTYTLAAYDAAGNVSNQGPGATATTAAGSSGGSNPPPVPATPSPANYSGWVNTSYTYSTTLYPDPDGNQVKAVFDWGDGTSTETGFVTISSGGTSSPSVTHTWSTSNLYSIKVKAVDSTGLVSSWSPTAGMTVGVPPASASNLSATVSGSNVTLTWTDNSNTETGFKLYRGPTWTDIGNVGANVTTYTVAGLAAGSYQFKVQAFTNCCNSTYPIYSNPSDIVSVTIGSVTTDTTAPTTPPVPALNILSASQINLTWGVSSDNVGVAGYKVYRCTCGNTNNMVYLGSVSTPSYSDVGLIGATTYTYAVAAYDAAGNNSPQGPAASGTTFAGTATDVTPPIIQSVRTENISGGGAQVKWSTNENATSKVEYGTAGGSYALSVSTDCFTNNLSIDHCVNLTGLAVGTRYYYRVRSADSAGNFVYSTEYSFMAGEMAAGVPPTPSDLKLDPAPAATAIYLAWKDNSDNETKFSIEKSPAGTGGWTFLGYVASNITNYTDGAVATNGRYDYRVQACRDTFGCSAYIYLYNVSPTVTSTVAPSPKVQSWGAGVTTTGSSTIGVSFSLEMDQGTLTTANIFVHRAADPQTNQVPARIEPAAFGANLFTNAALIAGEDYISVVKTAVKSKAGMALEAEYSCRFKALGSGNYVTCPSTVATYKSTLVGTISDTTGHAIGNVGVNVFTKDFTMNFGGSTGSDGSYSINLPAGLYMVEFFPPTDRKDLIKPAVQSIEIKDLESKRFNIQLGIATQSGKVISGVVKFSNGKPVTDAQVAAYNQTANQWVDTATDGLGQYKLVVGPGQYDVAFHPQNPTTSAWQWTGTSQQVVFQGDLAETKILNFTVPVAENKVVVKIVDEFGVLIPNAGVSLDFDVNAGTAGAAQFRLTDAQGTVVFFAPPGKYVVRGHLPPEQGFVNPAPRSIELLDGKIIEITLSFSKLKADTSITITGSVIFDNGAPGKGAFIWGWSEAGGNAYGRTNDKGEFLLTVPSKALWRLGAGKELDGYPYKTAEVTINTQFETSDISLILLKYSNIPLPKSVEVARSATETVIAKTDDGAQVIVPPNAAGSSGTVNIAMKPTIEVSSQANAKIVGTVWDVGIKNQAGTDIKEFSDKIEITFPYDEDKLKADGVGADVLKPRYYDEASGSWVELTDYTLDKNKKSFIIRVNHLTRFALVAPADTTPPATPAEFSYQLTAPTEVTLTWVDPKADFHHTRVSRTENKLEPGAILSELIVTGKYADKAVSIGKTYYYYLEAVDAAGNSSKTSELLKVTVTGSTSGPSATSGVSPEKYPSGLLFKYADNATVYLLKNGIKYPITDFSVFKNYVSGNRSIVTIPSSVSFDSGSNLSLKSGTLIKSKSADTVYLVIENKKRPFTSAEEFLGLGYRFHQIQAVDDTAVAAMETTTDLARPSGTIFQYAGKTTIYMLEGGKKRAFPSLAVVKAWVDPTYVITMLDSEIYPDGATMLLPSGVMVKGTSSTIYLVFDGTLRPLASTKIMTNLGFKSSQVIKVSASDLKLHPIGDSIK